METKTFETIRLKNGRGTCDLSIVFGTSIPDVYAGTALLVPVPEGLKDPIAVSVLVDEKGIPMRTNIATCIVTVYIH